MSTPITLLADFYKLSHREQYPAGTQFIYSTLTPRVDKRSEIIKPYSKGIVFFGLQYFIKKYLIDRFNKDFFSQPKEKVIAQYVRLIENTLGVKNVYTKHLEDLHDLGYLPLRIKALPEGSYVPIKVPCVTIENTNPNFFWLTNFIETCFLNSVWLPSTSATTASIYSNILTKYAIETVGDVSFVSFQAHDFSMRGMSSEQSAETSGAAHLLFFKGSDNIPAGIFLEDYYNANVEKELVFTSIPATEHSVMSAYGKANEMALIKHLITDIYPSGAVSIVSDTWDFWKVVTDYLPKLKDVILGRDGKLVIRPDSGNPVDILCGTNPNAGVGITAQEKGLFESLWDIFGGTINSKGYKVLDSHIGVLYGDGITLERCLEIMERMKEKGFASSNIVLGIGTCAYQCVTRDMYGWAMKATYAVINGQEHLLQKDPKTDEGVKKSHRGLVVVSKRDDGTLCVLDGMNRQEHDLLAEKDMLKTVFVDGRLLRETSLHEIRNKVRIS